MTTPADATWYWRPRPAECVRPRTAESLRRETYDIIRELEREHMEDFRALVALYEMGLEEVRAQYEAAYTALAHSDALAREEANAKALARTWDALTEFEVRAARDPAGAARALCRWLEKVRASGERKAA